MRLKVHLQLDKAERAVLRDAFTLTNYLFERRDLSPLVRTEIERMVHQFQDGNAITAELCQRGVDTIRMISSEITSELSMLEEYARSPKPTSPNALITDPAAAVETIKSVREMQRAAMAEGACLLLWAKKRLDALAPVTALLFEEEDTVPAGGHEPHPGLSCQEAHG